MNKWRIKMDENLKVEFLGDCFRASIGYHGTFCLGYGKNITEAIRDLDYSINLYFLEK